MRNLCLVITLLLGLLAGPSFAEQPRVTMSRGKQPGSVLIKVDGAGPSRLRVTVPWGVAHRLAFAAKHGGGLKVSTAQDGFTGNIVRLVAGTGKDTILLERSRRAGPDGQSGSAALRYQQNGLASFLGRTSGATPKDDFYIKGRSSVSRGGRAYPMNPYSLGRDENRSAEQLGWYAKSTARVTSAPLAPLHTFRLAGEGRPVTARPATLVTTFDLGI